jgi:hypothetical protein
MWQALQRGCLRASGSGRLPVPQGKYAGLIPRVYGAASLQRMPLAWPSHLRLNP